jgi:hypothetical protein
MRRKALNRKAPAKTTRRSGNAFLRRHGHQPGVLDGAGRDRAGFSAADRLRCAVLDGVSYCNELKG